MGKVYLIGAGPGDEELLTLKAARILSTCTAVMYDRLVNSSILRHLNNNCEIYYCGKEPGCHYKTQEEINEMLVSLAKKGHIVGRIKGGDPFVFGRGGEEILHLRKENIEFEVIPGITSALSVLNYAGIPVTHRKIAQSFHVFTGKSAEELNIDWNSIATLKGTLIFLMGLGNLQHISFKLIESGMEPNCPCAVIMRGTTAKQRKVVGTLQNIVEKVKESGLQSPCIIVVGNVVNFQKQFAWYEKKPLFGKNICVTRSKGQARQLREKLLDMGAEVTEINSIQIKNRDEKLNSYLQHLEQYNYVVFTSVNGVNIFFNKLLTEGIDIRKIKASFAAIGAATAEAIRSKGVIPEIIAEQFVAEALFDKLTKYVKPGDRILIPRSKNARPYLREALTEFGCQVDEVHIYEVILGELKDERGFDEVDIVLFTSPSTVENTIAMVGIEKVKSKECIAIGPITQKALIEKNIPCKVCDQYSVEGIIKKLLEIRGE
ncbi:uroporphyrinogen-III C-methyltransferase [Tepidimicrobium xylanilyticum]|uniref:uroporphyrinogen-III C-methyltransferase n=1 Tax=Tepidimicrobium xylanilyticum TaxID=1123352 RepID=A0A1H3DCU2_9FIRM|nr:uroporphyrinogen-III C-methyltransferase [Tepidimicrobium xylanilyticum]GMG97389.1 uroporphyrinogen-III C-methyltransferase [Tepidimicrobium xylanilyticum]SDX64273.1 uroporphyrinogen III methyltransferase / synthase [Tepidimicrobium xylanilyticum]